MNILDLELKELEKIIKEAGLPGFRAKQIFGWIAKGCTEPESMRNVPASFWETIWGYIEKRTFVNEQYY